MIKVFHFTNKPAFPLKDGGCIAVSSILASLLHAEETEVFHFALSTHKHPFTESAYPESWRSKMQLENMFINTEVKVFGAIYYLLKNESYNVVRFYDKKVEDKIKEYLDQQHFDVAIFEGVYLLPYLHLFKKKGIKVILRTHNIEYQIWESLARNTTSFFKKKYLNKLTQQLKKYELENCAKVDGIIPITKEDAQFFQDILPAIPKTSIPPIVNIDIDAYQADYSLSDFYFLGSMDWKPNIEGIEWFLEKVIPGGIERTQFYLAGKGLKKNAFNHPSVVNVGEVENAFDFIQQHGICVNPIHSGSGLKVKLLENMAMGKPIITTSEGIRGVDVTHGEHVMIANHPNDFKDYMFELNFNESQRKKLGTNAKEFIRNNYSKENITKRLLAFINKI